MMKRNESREQAMKSYHELEYMTPVTPTATAGKQAGDSSTATTKNDDVTPASSSNKQPRPYSMMVTSSTSLHDVTKRKKQSGGMKLMRRSVGDVRSIMTSSSSSSAGSGKLAVTSSDDRLAADSRDDEKFFATLAAAREGVTHYLDIVNEKLAELQDEKATTAAQEYNYEKRKKHLSWSKEKLQFHITQIDESKEKYKFHRKYKQGADNLRSAMSEMIISHQQSSSSDNDITSSSPILNNKLNDLERRVEKELLGRFHFKMKGLLGYARLKSGDGYEMTMTGGDDVGKWKSRGRVMTAQLDQQWDNFERGSVAPLIRHPFRVKVKEVGVFGKKSTIGSVEIDAKNLFKIEDIDLKLELNDTATLKLNFEIKWRPFDGFSLDPTTKKNDAGGGDGLTTTPKQIHAQMTGSPAGAVASPNSNNNNNNAEPYKPPPKFQLRPLRRCCNLNTAPRPCPATWSASSNNNNNGVGGRSNEELNENLFRSERRKSNKTSPILLSSTPTTDRLFEEMFHRQLDAVDRSQELREIEKEKAVEREKKMDEMSPHERYLAEMLGHVYASVTSRMENVRGEGREEVVTLDRALALLEPFQIKLGSSDQEDGNGDEDDDVVTNHRLDSTSSSGSDCDATDCYLTTGAPPCDEALLPHLRTVLDILKKVGVYGPLRVGEVRNLHNLHKHARIIERIVDIATKPQLNYQVLTEVEFADRREFEEFWKSCCHGKFALTTSGKILRLELEMEFGEAVRSRHHEVSGRVFPAFLSRVIQFSAAASLDGEGWEGGDGVSVRDDRATVTLFQLVDYITNVIDVDDDDEEEEEEESGDVTEEEDEEEREKRRRRRRKVDMSKLIDLLAYEMFVNAALSSGKRALILTAIKRLSSLLAMNRSNLCLLSRLLLSDDAQVRNASAAHIRHLNTEDLLREKAIISYAELLECEEAITRKCACLALGFLSANQIIPQLSYLMQTDPDPEVRRTCSQVLLSFGDEGEIARRNAESSLANQMMTSADEEATSSSGASSQRRHHHDNFRHHSSSLGTAL